MINTRTIVIYYFFPKSLSALNFFCLLLLFWSTILCYHSPVIYCGPACLYLLELLSLTDYLMLFWTAKINNVVHMVHWGH